MRFAILFLAAVLTAGLLATASLATEALAVFDGWSPAQQRIAAGGMSVLSMLICWAVRMRGHDVDATRARTNASATM